MKTVKITGSATAVGPICHNGNEKSGSTITFRRMEMITSRGERKSIPFIDGNAIRGNLRRRLMEDFFERLGLGPGSLEPRIYHMFFSGGALEAVSSGAGEFDAKLRKDVLDLLPPIRLLGASFLNQIVSGRLTVSKMYIVCEEMKHFFDAFGYVHPATSPLLPVESYTGEIFQTRKDDRLFDKADDDDPIQMKVETEVLVPGTRLMHYFMVQASSDLDESVLHHLLDLWDKRPSIGGKSSTGNGLLMLSYPDVSHLADPSIYLKFVEERKPEITAFLKRLGETSKAQSATKPKSTKSKRSKPVSAPTKEAGLGLFSDKEASIPDDLADRDET